jgi:sugar lactone lactonase YvrE
MAAIVEEIESAEAIIFSEDGTALWNSFQMDKPIVRRKYDDGTIDIVDKKSGRVIFGPFDPNSEGQPKCRHCGEVL